MKSVVQVLEESMELLAGIPHPGWSALRPHIELNVPPALQAAAWTTVASHWVVLLQRALGEGYGVLEHGGVMLVSPLDRDGRRRLADYVQRTGDRIAAALAPVARIVAPGPLVIVHLDRTQVYDRYISAFYPSEGSFMASGGVYVPDGYPHVVVHGDRVDMIESTLAHELTHAALSHRRLPRWLDEGVATVTEQELHERYWYLRDHRGRVPVLRGDADAWRFFSGETFTGAHRAAEESYVLAAAVVRLILRDAKDRFVPFLEAARHDDHGESAARDVLGISLKDLVRELYGQPRACGSSCASSCAPQPTETSHVMWATLAVIVVIALMAAM